MSHYARIALLALLFAAAPAFAADKIMQKRYPLPEQRGTFVLSDVDGLKSDRIVNEIKVVELQGKNVPGYYYAATDKQPGPDEFKYLTQDRILVSEQLLVTFAILTNDGQEQVVRDAPTMIRSSSHSTK